MTGCLILVATPIGNLSDLSPRAEQELRDADVIACEDTRHTRKLLSARRIEGKRLLAVHDHNEHAAAAGLVSLIQSGQRVALVTDAGTPGISDPGQRVVAAVAEAGYDIIAIPGPAALIVALVVSGLPTDRFVFEGFLPAKGAERKARLGEIGAERRTTILYEAPHRIVGLLTDLLAVCGPDRKVSVSRELSKKFESTWRGTLADAGAQFPDPRGEFVVVLAGAQPVEVSVDDDMIRVALAAARASGLSNRDAIQAVSDSMHVIRKHVYDLATGAPSTGAPSTRSDGNRQNITEP
jgi:16S rRNA (cytidine1402-2'-O)-methyltransferase